jgi:hypothetical protein
MIADSSSIRRKEGKEYGRNEALYGEMLHHLV